MKFLDKVDNLIKKPSSLGVGILVVFLIAAVVVLPLHFKQEKQQYLRVALLSVLLGKDNKAKQLTEFQQLTSKSPSSGLSFMSSKADWPTPEEVCENAADVYNFLGDIYNGQEENPFQQFLDAINANPEDPEDPDYVDPEDIFNDIFGDLSELGLDRIMITYDEHGTPHVMNMEEFVDLLESMPMDDILLGMMEGIDEMMYEVCEEYWGSGSGMGSASY